MKTGEKDPDKIFTIVIGGDSDADDRELFENPEKGMKQPRNKLYLNTFSDLKRWLSSNKLEHLAKIMTYGSSWKGGSHVMVEQPQHIQLTVSRDLHKLAKMDLLQLQKKGKGTIISTPFKSIQIQFAQKT
jgi:predicted transcriptional regulator